MIDGLGKVNILEGRIATDGNRVFQHRPLDHRSQFTGVKKYEIPIVSIRYQFVDYAALALFVYLGQESDCVIKIRGL